MPAILLCHLLLPYLKYSCALSSPSCPCAYDTFSPFGSYSHVCFPWHGTITSICAARSEIKSSLSSLWLRLFQQEMSLFTALIVLVSDLYFSLSRPHCHSTVFVVAFIKRFCHPERKRNNCIQFRSSGRPSMSRLHLLPNITC